MAGRRSRRVRVELDLALALAMREIPKDLAHVWGQVGLQLLVQRVADGESHEATDAERHGEVVVDSLARRAGQEVQAEARPAGLLAGTREGGEIGFSGCRHYALSLGTGDLIFIS